jgi:single-strand DNA-binding protein
MDINSVTMIGRLGKDPELKYTQNEKAVCSLNVALNDGYGDTQHTSWINVVCWGKTAENVAKYCVKGSQIAIVGRLSQRSWDDKDGNKRYAIEVIADRVQFIGAKKQDAPAGNDVPPVTETVPGNPFNDDDVPF